MSESKIYECVYTENPIKIDGSLADPAWQKGKPLEFYVPITNETPISKTEACMLWDDQYLYVGFKAYDKDIWSYFTDRDSKTFHEDVLETFIQTDPDADPYYNFEINANGAIYDAYSLKRGAGGEVDHRWAKWDCLGTKTGIFIKGEKNNPEVVDEYWQLEVAIPFAELPSLKGKSPNEGDEWLFHLSRYDYSIHLPNGVELSSTSRMSKEEFHDSQEWDRLRFVK